MVKRNFFALFEKKNYGQKTKKMGEKPPGKLLVTPLGPEMVLLSSRDPGLQDKKNRKSIGQGLRVASTHQIWVPYIVYSMVLDLKI